MKIERKEEENKVLIGYDEVDDLKKALEAAKEDKETVKYPVLCTSFYFRGTEFIVRSDKYKCEKCKHYQDGVCEYFSEDLGEKFRVPDDSVCKEWESNE